MIRFSSSPRFEVTRIVDDRSPTNAAFAARVADETTAAERRGALLLVGATDPRALAVRRAQCHLRLDRRPSYWSHAALLVSWEQAGPESAIGVEVSLDPEDMARQVPERNGVTAFRLARYLDAARYPNLCVATVDFPKSPDIKDRICEAALRPNVERARYPFWDQLAAWARHAYAPSTTPNPLF
ncbi:MAG TPA: hypothetical protein VLS89_16340, partial [Candidatus Nanopelagicales bacterium]|nr:hypothetical protein [Candidatus Nanopelagicales bacterium]